MEKRAILAIALSIAVLFGFRYLEEKRTGGVRRPPRAAHSTAPSAGSGVELPSAPQKTPQPAEAPAGQAAETAGNPVQVVVENDRYRAVVDNRGGVLSSWILKRYRSAKGEPFEMIAPPRGTDARSYPGALVLDDAGATVIANREPYQVEHESPGAALSPPAEVKLRLRRGDLEIEKSFRFLPDNYLVDYTVSARKGGAAIPVRVLLGQDLGPEDEHLSNPSAQLGAIAKVGDKIQRESPPKNDGEVKRVDGSIGWVGLDMHYFALIAIPAHPVSAFEAQKIGIKTTGLDGKEIARELLRVTVPVSSPSDMTLFVGPKDQEVLSGVRNADLTGAIDFGMFSIIVRPLLFSLKLLYRYVHNYGLAIILLTLLLTLALFPARLKQMLSMKKMQVVQPRVKEIQERYKKYKKTDPRRAEMNQEIMAVYREHNVNPLGGCLPLLLQMPLLFAFYQLLASAIELRQAPFFGWIHDLSLKDPYYVLPIVMGVTMLISQKMTPMAPGSDPTQAKMMMMMPAIFTLMFLNVSSGLNLYFLCSNIFQIGFQKLTEKWMGDASSKGPARKKTA
jgi:YidC/Oxa1 family membrane protein insertase